MTVNAILQEIEKRLDYLEKKRTEINNQIPYVKVYGNNKKLDKLLNKRTKIDYEREKLKDMKRAYKAL